MIREWKSVEPEAMESWNKTVTKIFEQDLVNSKPPTCPSCGASLLKFFFVRHGVGSRGGFWVWCSECYRYLHSSCAVPVWWTSHNNVHLNDLTPQPEWLEENWEQIA